MFFYQNIVVILIIYVNILKFLCGNITILSDFLLTWVYSPVIELLRFAQMQMFISPHTRITKEFHEILFQLSTWCFKNSLKPITMFTSPERELILCLKQETFAISAALPDRHTIMINTVTNCICCFEHEERLQKSTVPTESWRGNLRLT